VINNNVQRAIVAASRSYSTEDWFFSMSPQQRTEAIYREMRRLDAETVEQLADQSAQKSKKESAVKLR
jgi:hypothetical protein